MVAKWMKGGCGAKGGNSRKDGLVVSLYIGVNQNALSRMPGFPSGFFLLRRRNFRNSGATGERTVAAVCTN